MLGICTHKLVLYDGRRDQGNYYIYRYNFPYKIIIIIIKWKITTNKTGLVLCIAYF